MACTIEHPCARPVTLVLSGPTHQVYECLNAHSLIVGTPPKLRVPPPTPRPSERTCGYNGCRNFPWSKFSRRCRIHAGRIVQKGCRGCQTSRSRQCAKHGGVSRKERKREYDRRYRASL